MPEKTERFEVNAIIEIPVQGEYKRVFRRCGVGFRNRDGSINFKLDILPTQFHIAPAREKDQAQQPGQPRRASE